MFTRVGLWLSTLRRACPAKPSKAHCSAESIEEYSRGRLDPEAEAAHVAHLIICGRCADLQALADAYVMAWEGLRQRTARAREQGPTAQAESSPAERIPS